MLPITERVITELDVLYGLYLLALDESNRLVPDDDESIVRTLESRDKILTRTEAAASEALKWMQAMDEEKNIPVNELALIAEKRRMILDVVGKITRTDSLVLREMHSRLGALRRELARHGERRNAIHAYITAPSV